MAAREDFTTRQFGLLRQEYPVSASEAFVSSTFNFIPAALVIKARQEKVEPYGPLIIGVDPAGVGADRTAIAWRRGHRITKIETRRGLDTMEIVAWLGKIITDEKPAKVNIDVGGMGVGIFDRIMELGHCAPWSSCKLRRQIP